MKKHEKEEFIDFEWRIFVMLVLFHLLLFLVTIIFVLYTFIIQLSICGC